MTHAHTAKTQASFSNWLKPQYSVQNAIDEITAAYRSGDLPEGDNCYTVKWMKHLQLEANG